MNFEQRFDLSVKTYQAVVDLYKNEDYTKALILLKDVENSIALLRLNTGGNVASFGRYANLRPVLDKIKEDVANLRYNIELNMPEALRGVDITQVKNINETSVLFNYFCEFWGIEKSYFLDYRKYFAEKDNTLEQSIASGYTVIEHYQDSDDEDDEDDEVSPSYFTVCIKKISETVSVVVEIYDGEICLYGTGLKVNDSLILFEFDENNKIDVSGIDEYDDDGDIMPLTR
jgi:hypothetical protein